MERAVGRNWEDLILESMENAGIEVKQNNCFRSPNKGWPQSSRGSQQCNKRTCPGVSILVR